MNLLELWDDQTTTAVDIDLDARKAHALQDERRDLVGDLEDHELSADQVVQVKAIDAELLKLKPGAQVVTIHVKTPLNGDRMRLAMAIQEAEQTGAGWDVVMRLCADYIASVDGQAAAIDKAGGVGEWLRRLKSLRMQKAIVDAVTDNCLIPEPDAKN